MVALLSGCGGTQPDNVDVASEASSDSQENESAVRSPAAHLMAVELGASMYVGLEVCGADEDRLEATKQRFSDMAAERGVARETFAAAFDARLAKARSRVKAEAATLPEDQRKQACQDLLGRS